MREKRNAGEMPKKDLFASSSSSDASDDDGNLEQQMASAAAREKRRDPHAYAPFVSGRKKKVGPGGSATVRSSSSDGEESSSSTSDKNDGGSGIAAKSKKKEETGVNGRKSVRKEVTVDGNNEYSTRNNDGDDGGIRINKQYAAKYEVVKRQKELRQLTEKYGNRLGIRNGTMEEDDDDEEDEEDEKAVLLTGEKELAFAKVFLAIRSTAIKDKKKDKKGETNDGEKLESQGDVSFDNDNNDNCTEHDTFVAKSSFFPPPEEQMRENTEIFMQAMATKRLKHGKKFTLADEYRRGVVTEIEDVDNREVPANRHIYPQSAKERQIRESFLQSVAESSDTFTVKSVSATQQQQQQQQQQQKLASEIEAKRLLASAFDIRDTDDGSGCVDHNADEVFLRDFFVEELWKPGSNRKNKRKKPTQDELGNDKESGVNNGCSGGGSGSGSQDDDDDDEEEVEEEGANYAALAELAQAEEDERFYEDAEAWERAYQERAYRHQEESAEQVQSFPRPIGEHATGLLRKSAQSSRKEARMRRLQRMREVREQQVSELRRLKTLKRQEIDAQRALIASVAGITRSGNKGVTKPKDEETDDAAVKRLMSLWSEKELEEEFDPQKFDKKMAKLFDDAYYDEKNVDEDEMAFFEEEEEEEAERGGENEDGKTVKHVETKQKNRTVDKSGAADGIFDDDLMSLLYPSAVIPVVEEETLEGTREHIERMIRKQQQPQNEDRNEKLQKLRETLQNKEKEYWQLHHDSTLGGGTIKTRFKYRQVASEDFTISMEDILTRDDRQLNMIAPMDCYAAYLTEADNWRDRVKIERRRQRGFREIDTSRHSRRYGNVEKTVLVNPDMPEAEAGEWAEQVCGRLRRLRETMETDDHHEDGNTNVEETSVPHKQRKKMKIKKTRHEVN